eukprot:563181_1
MDEFNDSDHEPLTANEYQSALRNDDHDEYNSGNDKLLEVQDEIDHAKNEIRKGLVKAVERGDRLESISISAVSLQEQAGLFKKSAAKTRINFCVQKWKMIAIFVFILAVLGLSLGLWSLNMADDAHPLTNNDDINTLTKPITNNKPITYETHV